MKKAPDGCKIPVRYMTVHPRGLFRAGQPVILHDGRLLLPFAGMPKKRPLGTTKIWGVTSADGGFTWSEPEMLAHRDDCNVDWPSALRTRDGSLFIFYIRFVRWAEYSSESKCDVAFYVSRGGILDFEEEGLIFEGYGCVTGAMETSEGNIVVPVDVSDIDAEMSVSIVFVSFDRGRTFKRSNVVRVEAPKIHVETGAMEPAVVELSDGRLLMLIRTLLGYQYESYSEDQGLTWSEPRQSPLASPGCPVSLLRLADGRLACCWNPRDPTLVVEAVTDGDRRFLHLAVSEDDGKTWNGLGPIAEGGSVCYPSMIEIEPNDVFIVWNNVIGDQLSWFDVEIEGLRTTLPPKR